MTKEETQEEQNYEQELRRMDSAIRPGAVFMVQLLMKEYCEMPSKERFEEVLSKYLGRIEQIGDSNVMVGFAAMDYMGKFKEGKELPIQLSISACDKFQADAIDEFRRSQMWDCDKNRILSECKYDVLANDLLGGALPTLVRVNMLMDYLEALVELYPQCEAVYSLNTGKLILAEEIRKKEQKGADRFLRFIMNVRFFHIQGKEDYVIDTLGLSLLYMEDIQYHFHDMNPNWVVHHAYSMAGYLLNQEACIEDGDTIDGIENGELVPKIQWKCHYEDALVQPKRAVIDVHMGEYAASVR